MIAMSRCGAICLMVGGPTPQGRGHTDAPVVIMVVMVLRVRKRMDEIMRMMMSQL